MQGDTQSPMLPEDYSDTAPRMYKPPMTERDVNQWHVVAFKLWVPDIRFQGPADRKLSFATADVHKAVNRRRLFQTIPLHF